MKSNENNRTVPGSKGLI